MTIPLYIALLLSFSFFLGLWVTLSRSPLIPDLLEWFVTHDPMTHDDVENWLIGKGRMKLFRLWTCPHCQSFWTSTLQGLSCSILLCGYLESPSYVFLWPVLVLAFYPLTLYLVTKLWKL